MSSMQNETIVFEPISTDVLKTGENFESSIYKMVDGKKVPAEEETSIIFQKYTGFAPSEFPKPGKKGPNREMVPNPPEKRDYIKIKLDPNDPNCMKLKELINKYDEQYENDFDKIFDEEGRKFLNKTDKKGKKINEYEFKPSIKEIEKDEDEEVPEGSKPKSEDYYFDTCKFKLAMSWAYYYNDEKLDANNTKIIKKAINDKRKMSKGTVFDKTILDTITVDLEFKDDDGDFKKISVKMGDIQSKKTNIDTAVFMRRPPEMVEGIKKPNECTEEELEQFYGEPKYLENCTSPEQFEKYFKNYSYIRFVFKPEKVRFWKMSDKKECAIQYVIYQIEIIREPFVSTSVKQNYKEYSFGGAHKKNLLIDQSVDSQYKETETIEAKVVSTKVSATNKTSKLDVEDSESEEEESGSENEESGSESEESESEESESEKEQVVSKKISKTTPTEKTNKKQVASKKK